MKAAEEFLEQGVLSHEDEAKLSIGYAQEQLTLAGYSIVTRQQATAHRIAGDLKIVARHLMDAACQMEAKSALLLALDKVEAEKAKGSV